MKTKLAALILMSCTFSIAFAQSDRQMAFEVASIKPSPPAESGGARPTGFGVVTQDPSLILIKQTSLKSLLIRAYGLKDFQIGGPDWLDTERYDVMAKLPEGVGQDKIPAMLQQLITQRFQTTLRWDTKQQTAYALVIDKGGPKLTPSADNSMQSGNQIDKRQSVSMSAAGPLKMPDAQISQLATFLSGTLGEPVADSTGLQGRYDISLRLTMQDLSAAHRGPSTSTDDTYTPTAIFDAVRDLGLRLQPQKVDVKYLTVVKAERIPTEN